MKIPSQVSFLVVSCMHVFIVFKHAVSIRFTLWKQSVSIKFGNLPVLGVSKYKETHSFPRIGKVRNLTGNVCLHLVSQGGNQWYWLSTCKKD